MRLGTLPLGIRKLVPRSPRARVLLALAVVLAAAVVALVIVAVVRASRRARRHPRYQQVESPDETVNPSPGPDPTGDPKKPPPGLGEPPAGAIVAESLRDFRTVDDSRVYPKGAGPEIENITQLGPRVFNFVLRQRGSWRDGDRDTGNPKKTRAEVSGLYPKGMKVGETWIIATTVRLDPTFVPAKGYFNIMQVFQQAYLTLGKVKGDAVDAELMVFANGIGSSTTSVRSWTITRGQWQSIRIRIKFAKSGRYEVSINNDPFQGINIDTTKGCSPCGTKWGLYGPTGTAVDGKPMRDLQAQHARVYLLKES